MQATYCTTLAIVSLLACGGAPAPDRGPEGNAAESPAARPPDAAPTVVVLGTSLTAGYGLDPSDAWPAALERRLREAGLPHRVVAAGVSGETSAGALRRVDWILEREPPDVFVLETGGNDGLRGLEPDSLKANLLAILRRAERLSPRPRLVLLAMEAPPNYGRRYTDRFRAVYTEAARESGAVLVPFFLDGVAGIDSLNLPDGIHPTSRGHDLAAGRVWEALRPHLP